MKVRELIQLLQECDPEKEIISENDNTINGIQELFFNNQVIIFTTVNQ